MPRAESARRRPSRAAAESSANLGDGFFHALADQLSLEMEDAVAQPLKRAIPARVCCALPRVIAAIHFDDEACGRCDEIPDEAPQRHLPPEPDAQRAAANGQPEPLLRWRKRRAHVTRTGDDNRRNLRAN